MSKRKETIAKTKQRRHKMTCIVYAVKVDTSKITQQTQKHLHNLFNEAKWMYNYVLDHKDISLASTTIKTVPVKTPEGVEQREFNYLSSQMKQGIKDRIFQNLMSLSALKKKGYKVGRLKFKGQINSIPLKQHKVTYTIAENKKYIKIQGLKQKLKVNGLDQIPPENEIANALLVRKASGFYIHITTYTAQKRLTPPERSIGIDFGCTTQLTLSNGIKIEYQVPVSDSIKKLDRRIHRKVNDKVGKNRQSKNRRKLQHRRKKLYEHLTNKKKDIVRKIVSVITKNYKYVCFQDESIHAWHAGNHGKKIQNSSIGGIISLLKNKSHTPIAVNKFFPSTQLCPHCGCLNKLKMSDRVYKCDCGFVEDRDIKSAKCIENEGISTLPTDRRELTPKDNDTSVFIHGQLSLISCIHASVFE